MILKRDELANSTAFNLVLTVVLTLVIIAVLIFACQEPEESHAKYATGTSYEVTGHVSKADVKDARLLLFPFGRRLESSIEITTEQELPDGSHSYVSELNGDYAKIERYADDPEKQLVFTVSETGALANSRPVDGPVGENGSMEHVMILPC